MSDLGYRWGVAWRTVVVIVGSTLGGAAFGLLLGRWFP